MNSNWSYDPETVKLGCDFDLWPLTLTFRMNLALVIGNSWKFHDDSPVSGEFPPQRPVARGLDVFFDLCLIKRLSKHSRGWWFETLSRPLWCHCNGALAISTTTWNRAMNFHLTLLPFLVIHLCCHLWSPLARLLHNPTAVRGSKNVPPMSNIILSGIIFSFGATLFGWNLWNFHI